MARTLVLPRRKGLLVEIQVSLVWLQCLHLFEVNISQPILFSLLYDVNDVRFAFYMSLDIKISIRYLYFQYSLIKFVVIL